MKEILYNQYWKEKRTLREIAEIHKVSHVSIINWFKNYNIPTRTRSESQLGRKLSNKTKLKMSLMKKGKESSFKGKLHKESSKFKISNSLKGKCGEQSRNWKGGLSFEPYPKEFNEKLKYEIKERDNFQCKRCESNEILHVHHIDYNKDNCEKSNLITLCNKCHSKSNSNRDYWYAYYRYLIVNSW